MTSEELALNIIHATGGDPKRAKEAAAVIDAWVGQGKPNCSVPLTEPAAKAIAPLS